MPQRVLIAGCGDVGSALGVLLAEQGLTVWGIRRDITKLPAAIQGISADLGDKDTLSNLPEVDVLIYCAAAPGRTEEAYQRAYVDGVKHVVAALPEPPKTLLFTSSTSVYGQADSTTVDEQSPAEPCTATGKIMRTAEQQVQALGGTAVRFSGIYGPGRGFLLERVKQGISAPLEPVSFTNRIHRDDCAGVLAHLVKLATQGERLAPVYLASDDQPAPLAEVMDWLAGELNVTITERSMSRGTGSKRCNNGFLRTSGYQFIYPSYREGYRALLAAAPPA